MLRITWRISEIFDEIGPGTRVRFSLIDDDTAEVAQDEVAGHFLKSNTRSLDDAIERVEGNFFKIGRKTDGFML